MVVLLVTGCTLTKSPEIHYDSLTLVTNFKSGFYHDEFDFVIKGDHKADIYYSLDGTEPNIYSSKYIDSIKIKDKSKEDNKISNIENISSLEDIYFPNFNVDKYTKLKVKGYDKFGNESPIYEFIFFVNLNFESYKDLPIVCLEVKNDDLFDYEKGIYVTGKTFDEGKKEGYPETWPANYNNKGKEWERPAHLVYFNESHEFEFSQDIGIRIHGGWSRAFNQKSFNLYARKEYDGLNTFKKPFFETEKLKTCMLRSGGYRDYSITKVRDTLNQSLAKSLDIEVQDGYPVIVFLNNEYWGIYNLQERFSSNYIEEHFDIDKDNVIMIEKDEIDEGTAEDLLVYQDMLNFFGETDLSNEANYLEASNILDIDSFIKYMSTELIIGNVDWPYNNYRVWRSRVKGTNSKEDNKWRFMMYDTDDSSGIISKCNVDSDPFLNESHWKNGPLDINCSIGKIFVSLLKNQSFRISFKSKFLEILNNVFNYQNVLSYLDKSKTLLKTPMVNNYERFVSNEYDKDYFIAEVGKITNFFKDRSKYLVGYLDSHISN